MNSFNVIIDSDLLVSFIFFPFFLLQGVFLSFLSDLGLFPFSGFGSPTILSILSRDFRLLIGGFKYFDIDRSFTKNERSFSKFLSAEIIVELRPDFAKLSQRQAQASSDQQLAQLC